MAMPGLNYIIEDYTPERRCLTCRKIPWDAEKHVDDFTLQHHESFAALEASAAAGCYLCRYFRFCSLNDDRSKELPPTGNCSVKLSRACITFGVGEQEYRGWCHNSYLSKRDWGEWESIVPCSLDRTIEVYAKDQGRRWIDDCSNKHEGHQKCDNRWFRPAVDSWRPTRLVDVGIGDSKQVRIVVTKEDLDKNQGWRYLTLSYCWGTTNESAKTTQATLASRRRGFDVHALPKTIRDAILLTRLLGFRYLWVDAICIIQPQDSRENSDDWEAEAPKVGSYYHNSRCLISALGASDSDEGLFMDRPTHKFSMKSLAWAFDRKEGKYSCPELPYRGSWQGWADQPLDKRGWCFQERLLSPHILHFSRYGFFEECMSDVRMFKYGFSTEAGSLTSFHLPWHIARAFHGVWYTLRKDRQKLVNNYLQRKLTYESDQLIAFQGVADHICTICRDEYFAGLFCSDPANGLSWRLIQSGNTAQRVKNIPTWSWASYPIRVHLEEITDTLIDPDDEFQLVLPRNRSPVNLDSPEKCLVRLNAPFLSIDTTVRRGGYYSLQGVANDYVIHPYYDSDDLRTDASGRLFVLLLGAANLRDMEYPAIDDIMISYREPEPGIFGIILRPQGPYYERIGCIELYFTEYQESQSIYWDVKEDTSKYRQDIYLI